MLIREPAAILARVGGAAPLDDLVAQCGRAALRLAVREGSIVRIARGRYALPETPDPRLAAVRLAGVVSYESAAEHWGLELATRATKPHVTVPARRGRLKRGNAAVHFATLGTPEVIDGVTSPLRTVLDLARSRELPIGLAAADSALRQQLILRGDLVAEAAAATGPGAKRLRRVAEHADTRAESVLESALRAILIEAGIRGFTPQLQIDEDGFTARVDLGDPQRRIVLEADSFAHHGHRSALARDCRRYTELSIRGWLVLRFAWEHVMFEPTWVADCVVAALRPPRPRR